MAKRKTKSLTTLKNLKNYYQFSHFEWNEVEGNILFYEKLSTKFNNIDFFLLDFIIYPYAPGSLFPWDIEDDELKKRKKISANDSISDRLANTKKLHEKGFFETEKDFIEEQNHTINLFEKLDKKFESVYPFYDFFEKHLSLNHKGRPQQKRYELFIFLINQYLKKTNPLLVSPSILFEILIFRFPEWKKKRKDHYTKIINDLLGSFEKHTKVFVAFEHLYKTVFSNRFISTICN